MKSNVMTLLCGWIAAACFALPVAGFAADAANAYAAAYKKRIDAPAAKAAGAEVRIYRGVDKEADTERLLQDGYDLLGVSSFKGGETPPEKAAAHAKNIKADLVMVYSARAGKLPGEVQAGKDDTKKEIAADTPEMQLVGGMEYSYEYYAMFWIKAK